MPDPALSSDHLRALIAACCRNDRQAQRRLFDNYAVFIYNIISRFSNDEHVVEEIQSEAFYRILVSLDQYRFEGAFEGWMRTITINVVARYFRKQRPDNVSLPEDSEDTALYVNAKAPGNMAFKELLGFIYELPPMQRAVFNLFIFEKYNHKEIAALLKMSENNSRWHLNDARRRLKEKITASNIE
jgi:RNA polymerase sigma factor (sigma-70 family)